MIKRIVIRDVASYDSEGVVLDNLQKVNFIYGGNGCGKTTLSRLLAGPENWPEEIDESEFERCEVEWEEWPIEVLVYNRDFKGRNLGR